MKNAEINEGKKSKINLQKGGIMISILIEEKHAWWEITIKVENLQEKFYFENLQEVLEFFSKEETTEVLSGEGWFSF